MKESNLIQVFNIIKLGESTYQQKIVKKFIGDLLQDILFNISSEHERPDFDRIMYSYKEKYFQAIKSYNCDASHTMQLKFNAIQSWTFNHKTEEYSDLEVEIINPRVQWMDMVITLDEWLPKWEVRRAILNSANGISVEDWKLKGDPRP